MFSIQYITKSFWQDGTFPKTPWRLDEVKELLAHVMLGKICGSPWARLHPRVKGPRSLATCSYYPIDMANKVFNIAIVGTRWTWWLLTGRLWPCGWGTHFSTRKHNTPQNSTQCTPHRQFQKVLNFFQQQDHRAITLEATYERRGKGLLFYERHS